MKIALIILASLFIPVLIWSLVAGIKVRTTFAKYSKVNAQSNLTGFQVAYKIMAQAGVHNVEVQPVSGKLTDHYDPRDNTIYLSESVYNSTSIAALGVAAHEAGHAIQYAKNYSPVKMRTAFVPIVSFTSKWSFPFLLIAILLEFILGYANPISNIVLLIAVCFYGCYAFFTLITLPVEYNASKRAKLLLAETGALTQQEVKNTAKVLRSAAQTYLAAFFLSLVQVARLLIMLISRRR